MFAKTWLTILLLPLCLTIGWQYAPAEIVSDRLFETIVDQNGKGVNIPLTFTIAEGSSQDVTFTIPALRVDFTEGPGGERSDTFFFNSFTVRVRSDGNPGGLSVRAGVPQIDREVFDTNRYLLTSDGNPTPSGFTSDRMTIQVAASPHGLRDVKDTALVEGQNQSATFSIDAASYDVLEPASESDFNPSLPVSDYLDFSRITGGFCSDNEKGVFPDCSNGLSVDGFVTEDPILGGALVYTLTFASDVPEPGTLSLLAAGLLGLGLATRRRRVTEHLETTYTNPPIQTHGP